MSEKQGSVLGALLLISGCCIGGGMLGVPVISSIAGFKPALAMFLLSWCFMATTAFLVLEVNLWFPKDVSLITMAGATLGKAGQAATWACFIFLFYALGVAYLSASGGLVSVFFSQYVGVTVPSWVGSSAISLLFGLFIYLGTYSVDIFNRFLMSGLIITYLLLVALGAPHIHTENLQYHNWKFAPWLLPVMIISFGFHNMIPSLKTYLGGDVKRLKKAVIFGSLLPLVIYFIWEWVILGLMSKPISGGLAEVLDEGKMATEMLKEAVGSLWVVDFTHYFAFFAIVTSFLGNSLSFVDFLADGLHIKKTPWGKILLCAMVIAPPFAMAVAYPNLFLSALNYAGAFGAVILFGILPALMAWYGRYRQERGTKESFMVPGGKILLMAVIFFAVCMMGMQFVLDKGA